MWSSKMAARWKGKDGLLNATNGDFPASNNTTELTHSRADVEDVERSAQSCMDHSILAIFEDSTVASESKSGVDEESETLLSALTEMLDTVEDDDTLSPFDTLPDTKLLINPGRRDSTAIMSLAERLRPRPKSPSVTATSKGDGEKGDEKETERHSFPQLFKQQSHAENKKAENEEQVLTSTSVVNLVKLMHSYCLRLYVDEGKKNHTVVSQGEVWRYEKPTEESDEEINVVSDDEAPVTKTKEEEQGDEKRDNGKLLKSVLVNGNSSKSPPSREKKRVSFGPVQVASFDESVEKGLNEKTLTSGHTSETVSVPLDRTKALENSSGPALESQIPSSETNSGKAEDVSLKGETKVKSLSLQQYRQLRQKRQPLVEKQGNYTTKWPSVSEPPKELPPILCLQVQNSCGQKTVDLCPGGNRITTDHLHKPGYKTSTRNTSPRHRPKPSEAKTSTHLHHSRLKRKRNESRIISPASPLPDITGNINVIVPGSKKSPVKKQTVLSSDPPNPVLLPLPVSQTAPPPSDHSPSEPKADCNLQNIRHENQNESSTSSPQRQVLLSEPKTQVPSLNQDGTALLQDVKDQFTEMASDITSTSPALCPSTMQTESASQCRKLQPQKCRPSPVKETKQEPNTPQSQRPDPESQIKCPPPTPFSAHPLCPAVAPIPAKEELPVLPGVSLHEEQPPALRRDCTVQDAAGDSGIEAPDLTSLLEQFEETQAKESMCESESKPKLVSIDLDQQRTAPVGSENASRLALEPLSTSKHPRNLPDLQMLERVDNPEAFSTEIILRTQQEHSARRRNPPSKAIQIIDARPLPSKKIHTGPLESPATNTSSHLTSVYILSVSSDHDYCGPVDHSLTGAAQRSRAKSSLLKDILQTISGSQVSSCDSSAAAAAAECKTQTSSGQEKSLSAQPEARSETGPSPDRALQFSHRISDDGGVCEHKTAQCTLPTPPPSPPSRGREKRRYRRRSPLSDSSASSRSSSSSSSSSSSASRSPKRQKLRHKCSESSSCSSSCSRSVSRSPPRRSRSSYSRLRPSRSRSRSWSASRSRSPSPEIYSRRWRNVYSSRESRRLRRECEMRIQKLKAIDERRVVYVGRIRRSMTHSELRERFSQFGEVECVTLHFRDRGDHYAFVTFYNMEDAFAAIDNGGKLRKPDELPFDICFGGRRQFCNSDYSDLDANREADLSPAKSRIEDLDFDSLLKQAQRGLKR